MVLCPAQFGTAKEGLLVFDMTLATKLRIISACMFSLYDSAFFVGFICVPPSFLPSFIPSFMHSFIHPLLHCFLVVHRFMDLFSGMCGQFSFNGG